MIELRRWVAADVPALVDAYADPVLRAGTRLHCTTPAEASAWIAMHDEGWAAGTRYGFAVVKDALVLGTVALKRPDPAGPRGEVGYWTVAAARGRGVAPRAVGLLTGWAFVEFPGLAAIDLFHRLGNPASCRVAVKSGYRYAETLPPEAPGRDGGHRHVRARGAAANPGQAVPAPGRVVL
ncbi:GNAT family N-acetyltransferase [Catenuloplanes indicus]|uniref:RimJ/RimL family protein N-acetyltransferase n=1 Tax=Catenuloplanes indicus TaxID=137267 RepID=A0AAE3W7A7_9ACTN|nr:GNAT family N-acetyltransferase [Catenuloplanes indicus]MDQ0370655.1 RimJ/RimL family protein N-acetyltransferase [Catenuloplanes indicus]